MVSDSGTIILVKGVSGSGKSTRVYCFLDYLKHIGMELKPYLWVNSAGVEKEIGVYAEDLNLLVLGKYSTVNGVHKWQGLDSVTGCFINAQGVSDFLQQAGRMKLNVLVEGAGTSVTWRLRPMELCAVCEYLNIFYFVYTFKESQWDAYSARLVYRSGQAPRSDAMWRKRKGFESDYRETVQQAEELNAVGANIQIDYNLYDVPSWDLGSKLLKLWGLADLCEEYVQYTQDNDYTSRNIFRGG